MAIRFDIPIGDMARKNGLTDIVGLVVGNLVEARGGDHRTGEGGDHSWGLVEDSHAAVLDLENMT